MDQQGPQRRQRRERKNRHHNPLLPRRPTRPVTGYGHFLREYFAQGEGNQMEARTLRTASLAWAELTREQRNMYTDFVAEAKETYTREMNAWKQIRKALRKPPTAYGLFIRERWNEIRRQGGTTLNVAEVGQAAARTWANLPQGEKRLFVEARDHMMTRYNEQINLVRNGNIVQQDWMTLAFQETPLGRRQQEQLAAEAAAAAAAEEEEQDGDFEEEEEDEDDLDAEEEGEE